MHVLSYLHFPIAPHPNRTNIATRLHVACHGHLPKSTKLLHDSPTNYVSWLGEIESKKDPPAEAGEKKGPCVCLCGHMHE